MVFSLNQAYATKVCLSLLQAARIFIEFIVCENNNLNGFLDIKVSDICEIGTLKP